MQVPLRRKDTKSHKELIFNNIHLVNDEALDEVKLGVLVPPPVPSGTFGRVGGKTDTFF